MDLPSYCSGLQMIRTVDIRRFRCFERLRIEDCARINVIVGDNGVGKTSLLEALFLALGSSAEIGIRFRQQRGLDGTFSGDVRRIEEAIWRDLFFELDWQRSIEIELVGDGPEARSLTIHMGPSQLTIPLEMAGKEEESRTAPILFRFLGGNCG
jgi:predicted ATPase